MLKKFEKEDDPLSAIVDYWLKGNETDPVVPISWDSLVVALKSCTVGEAGLAEKIKETYCRHEGSYHHPSPSPAPSVKAWAKIFGSS